MIDVFIRTLSGQNPLRHAFFEATRARWQMAGVRLRWLVDEPVRAARLRAERDATTDPYIFTDDDVLPWGKDWVEIGTAAMLANPEYGACSTRSVIAEEMGNYNPPEGAIYEVPAVGAPMWIRKGYLHDLPEFMFVEECIVIHNHLRLKGKKEGIIAGIRHLHLGFGFATREDLVRGY